MKLTFHIDSPHRPVVSNLLDAHLELMRSISPPESVHALDHAELEGNNVTFWSVWDDGDLCGCCALKEHSEALGEIKSMHILHQLRGKGIGDEMVKYLVAVAVDRAYKNLSLETGVEEEFSAARNLYFKHGFKMCEPFGDYWKDPHSVFMTLAIN